MTTKIFNGTPHSINIVTNGVFNPSLRKYVTDTPEVVMSIPSNGVLSAKVSSVDLPSIDGIPVHGKTFTGVDSVPEGYDVVIVSQMFVSGVVSQGGNTSNLFTVSDPVYSTDGKTIHGCRGICPFIQ
jgi:hypothetical protein